ncbi:tetratricopeptide repeat protein [Roseibacterium sp. SDUM158016]|uniref:tetratricopeptide repeat protein n=1 Tax=Roseicyclus sediminis TaxID=2980997 RepID=UPI0021D04FF7|nr:tetratricopeptide repeat protein [Roseibacterium sp. SDUM158016]MCU4651308.1 tetratricopeptide repeat protein [Roseibacterium sp. SDUM158016]
MLEDRLGNRLTTASQAARDAYVEGVDHILAATWGAADAFGRAISADPDFALAQAGLARALMYEGDMGSARATLARARELVGGATPREASHVAIFGLLLQGLAGEARAAVRAHVAEYPRDALAAQVCTNIFGLIGMSGEPGREAAQLAYTTHLMSHYGDDWWLLSVHAQALCEVGRLDEAMAVMERSLALNPANANASHFKAHTLYEAGETAAGRAYLATWVQGYDRRALLHGHLNWHRALWALEQGDEAEMWGLFEDGIAPGSGASLPINVLTDSAALLWRAELAGMEVDPSRWTSLSHYALQFFPDPGQSFADIHAALAHAMAGDGAALARIAGAERGFAADLVRPVADAWGAAARQDWQLALDTLAPVMADHARLGGSRAQRDLLELSYVAMLLKLGRGDEAHRTLRTRRPVFAASPPLADYA